MGLVQKCKVVQHFIINKCNSPYLQFKRERQDDESQSMYINKACCQKHMCQLLASDQMVRSQTHTQHPCPGPGHPNEVLRRETWV